jgi:hypothetical protein
MIERRHYSQYFPENGPPTAFVDGVAVNTSLTVYYWQLKAGVFWTLDRGNARRKNLRGPFINVEEAELNVREELKAI